MAFLSIGEIELITFFKPLVDDERMIMKKACGVDEEENEDDLVVCCDDGGKLLNWTRNFEFAK